MATTSLPKPSGSVSNSPVSGGNKFVVMQSKNTLIPGNTPSGQSAQPHYIVTPVAGNAANQNHGDHTAYQAIHYVSAGNAQVASAAETIVYANGQPLATSPYQTFGTTFRSPETPQYASFTTNNQIGTHNIQIQGEMIQHMGQTLFIPGDSLETDMYPLTHTTRAAPATVQWLLDNYETADGVSLPRSTLYEHYQYHCKQNSLDPMNPASFGKLIRSVFVGLRTRRLGTRGNSKYHYYGIRLKSSSSLNHLMPEETPVAMRQPAVYTQRRMVKTESDSQPVTPKSADSTSVRSESVLSVNQPTAEDKNKELLGSHIDAIPTVVISIEGILLPEGLTLADVKVFQTLYREHSQAILEVVISLEFSNIEALWQKFWRKYTSTDDERRLAKDKLFSLCTVTQIQVFIQKFDYDFYQSLVEVLIPDVLRPVTGSLTQSVRGFAKSLDGWMRSALSNVSDELLDLKLSTLTAFSQTLRRYTSLNHLAQAARAVLQNQAQIQQMLNDLNRVDFTNIQEQSSWVSQCPDTMVSFIEQSFKDNLTVNTTLEEWASWLEGTLDKILSQHQDGDVSVVARQCLLNWSFYCSMVIRDLTLRSAASFGSFHLIRLLFDEYLVYLVEHKVAGSMAMTPLTVTSQLMKGKRSEFSSSMEADEESAGEISLDSALNGHDGIQAMKRYKFSSDPLLVFQK